MDWAELHPRIATALLKLPDAGWLLISREGPDCFLQFARTAEGLRAEVCNESPEDEPRLRDRGWELTDSWSGVWGRHFAWPSDAASAEAAVIETTHVVRNLWRVTKPDGFTYLAWLEAGPKQAWEFWKSGDDKELLFPELGLPKGQPRKD